MRMFGMTISARRISRVVAALFAITTVIGAVGCGGGGGGGNGDNGDPGERGDPLSLQETQIGAGIAHGMVGHLRDGTSTDQENLASISDELDHAFLRLQPYDEHARVVGEWESYEPAANTTGYRRVGDFQDTPAAGRLAVPNDDSLQGRASDLVEEFQTSFSDDPPTMSMVIDFWRSRDDWYVRWDGNFGAEVNVEGQGPYGFYHEPMVESLLSQLEQVAEEHEPQFLVIGSDMERLLATDDGEGLAPTDWSNFTRFYRRAADRIRDASGQTRVAVGINWDRFALQVTPRYVGSGEPGEVPSRSEINEAIDTFLAPMWRASDAIALKSYRQAGMVDDNSYFAPLANLQGRSYVQQKPLVWYSVGAPSPTGNDTIQRNMLSAFLEWNRGVEPVVVGWRMLKDYHGSRDPIDGRCKTLVESEDHPLPREHCFDGLYDEPTSPKAPMELIQEETDEMQNGG